ncbi:primase-like DNA-binding domain-containing protein [Nocardioides pocheonensis]|uniref:DNA primase/nucleoside triphosphatase C-terminal domain-containing protein n=1 Tax=Nocardioides pocheonensis TaxID=661485 RepID=A0A3N0GY88_9ACTN|nr:primase-like DNA-binding domain-containing protein [Nocardioides pocheonensis]RNM17369.1 hypothetical protein EFL26_00845 [Nocardioides pocheonensis]
MSHSLSPGDTLSCPNCGHEVATINATKPTTVAGSRRLGVVKDFADTCLETRIGNDLSNARLHEEYTWFAEKNGHEPLTVKGLTMALNGLGYESFRRSTMRGIRDVALTQVHLSEDD